MHFSFENNNKNNKAGQAPFFRNSQNESKNSRDTWQKFLLLPLEKTGKLFFFCCSGKKSCLAFEANPSKW
jgi:hypothetical protein